MIKKLITNEKEGNDLPILLEPQLLNSQYEQVLQEGICYQSHSPGKDGTHVVKPPKQFEY